MQRLKIMMQGWAYLLFASLIAAAGQGGGIPSGGVAKTGHWFYTTYCSACHGMEGRGNGPVAPELRTPPADLTQIAKRRGGTFPVMEIAATIDGRTHVQAHGSRDMPVWGESFGESMGSVTLGEEVVRGNLLIFINYLKSIQQ